MSSLLHRLGRTSARHPWRVIAVWFAVAVITVATASVNGGETTDTFDVPGVDSQIATELLTAAGDDQAGVTARVVVADAGAVSPGIVDDVRRTLLQLDDVVGVSAAAIGEIDSSGDVALLTVQYPGVDALDAGTLDDLLDAVADSRGSTGVTVEAGGELFFHFEEASTSGAEVIGLAVAVVVLLVAFGSLLAAGLPIGIALFGLAISVSSLSVLANVIDVPSWGGQLGAMIGLGVGIDYALFLVTRQRELLGDGFDVDEAVGRSVATSGQAVVFAGGTVVVAILGLAVAGVPVMTSGGVAISLVVLVMVLAAISLLPALLGLAGHRLQRVRLGRGGERGVGSRWAAWGRHVAGHAWTYAIGVTAVLLALTAPILDLQLGFPDDGTQAEGRTQRRAYDLVADGFGPGANGPLLIAVDLAATGAGPEVFEVVDDLAAAVAADPGIASVEPPSTADGSDVASFVALPTTAPQEPATFTTVERLRRDVLPEALGDEAATAHVGGATATFGDVANRVSERLPLFIAAVIGLSFLLLTVLFRSVLVPLKAAILNLLSIGAAYGVLVAVFQWGWGASLIGLETTVPIVSFIPMFMFAILFGLSMDYEVFLLSRVREEYLRTGDNDHSVITGIATTARVITSAALIMISVFAGFVIGDDPLVKMMGLGLATAIFVDATIVRLVLVPATMKLLGDANWWLPTWLDRMLPHVDVEVPRPAADRADGSNRVATAAPSTESSAGPSADVKEPVEV
ncbi:MAG: MMPL family transporter [Actinomycetota bacterium]